MHGNDLGGFDLAEHGDFVGGGFIERLRTAASNLYHLSQVLGHMMLVTVSQDPDSTQHCAHHELPAVLAWSSAPH